MEEKSVGSQGKTPLLGTEVADVLGGAAWRETRDISVNPELPPIAVSRSRPGGVPDRAQTPGLLRGGGGTRGCRGEGTQPAEPGRKRAEYRLQLKLTSPPTTLVMRRNFSPSANSLFLLTFAAGIPR